MFDALARRCPFFWRGRKLMGGAVLGAVGIRTRPLLGACPRGAAYARCHRVGVCMPSPLPSAGAHLGRRDRGPRQSRRPAHPGMVPKQQRQEVRWPLRCGAMGTAHARSAPTDKLRDNTDESRPRHRPRQWRRRQRRRSKVALMGAPSPPLHPDPAGLTRPPHRHPPRESPRDCRGNRTRRQFTNCSLPRRPCWM